MPMQLLAIQAIHEFELRYMEDRAGCLRHYDRIEGSKHTLLEIKISGGRRLIAHWVPGTLTLIDLGGHETPDEVRALDISRLLREARPAESEYYRETHNPLIRLPAKGFRAYANELSPEWIYHLDPEQTEVLNALFGAAVDATSGSDTYHVHFLIGGPGTGKTSIILHLLKELSEGGEFAIRMQLSAELRKQVEASLPMMDLGTYMACEESQCEILLYDDIDSMMDVDMKSGLWKPKRLRFALFAFDPLQLSWQIADSDFDKRVRDRNIFVHRLRTCYRQKENVGRATKMIAETIARSTPFLAAQKIRNFHEEHARLTEFAIDLEFPNPMGHVSAPVSSATRGDLERELKRISTQPGGLWRHTCPVLVITIDIRLRTLPAWVEESLRESGVEHTRLDDRGIRAIKGLEFQHVIIILGNTMLAEITKGFRGSGQSAYASRKLIRIPFSRAKDSLAVLGLAEGI